LSDARAVPRGLLQLPLGSPSSSETRDPRALLPDPRTPLGFLRKTHPFPPGYVFSFSSSVTARGYRFLPTAKWKSGLARSFGALDLWPQFYRRGT